MLYFILFFAIVLLDQISKTVVDALDIHVELIDNIFSVSNVRNPGMAFSWLSDVSWAQTFFIVATTIVVVALLFYFMLSKKQSKLFRTSLIMIMAGAVGNFIDRLALKEVRDFIYVHFFANFNVADIFVCVGAFLLALYIIFFDEDAIFSKKK